METARKWWKENNGTAILAATFITAAITYFYYLILEPKNSDCFNEGLLLYDNAPFDMSLGRWMTPVCIGLSWFIVHPLLYLCFYFLCAAVSSVILVDVFGIRSRHLRILTGAVMAVAPAITGQILYIHEVPTYAAALLLTYLAILLLTKKDSPLFLVIASLIMAAALGAFQSVIGMMLFTLTGCLLLKALNADADDMSVFLRKCLRYALFVFLSVAVYWLVFKVYLLLSKTSASDYAGVDKVSAAGFFQNFATYIKRPYHLFIGYFRDDPLSGTLFWSVLIVTAMIGGAALTVKIVRQRSFWRLPFILILVIVMPLGANIIDIIAPEHGLQLYQMQQLQLMAPFCAAVISMALTSYMSSSAGEVSKSVRLSGLINKGVHVISTVCLAGLILSYCLQAYCSFRTLDIGSRHIKYCIQSSLTHALEDDARSEDMPIVFLGFVSDEEAQKLNPLQSFSYFDNAYPFWKEYYEVFGVWPKYCAYYFGTDIGSVTHEQYENILNSKELNEMEPYPSGKAYAVIDGAYVILLDRDSIAR